jgi:hypothetical protein
MGKIWPILLTCIALFALSQQASPQLQALPVFDQPVAESPLADELQTLQSTLDAATAELSSLKAETYTLRAKLTDADARLADAEARLNAPVPVSFLPGGCAGSTCGPQQPTMNVWQQPVRYVKQEGSPKLFQGNFQPIRNGLRRLRN